MQKLINDPFAVVDEMLDGFIAAHGAKVRRLSEAKGRAVVRTGAPIAGKVGVIVGGGSGHEPAFIGYVGAGGADGAAIGNVFASPPPDPAIAAAQAVHGGAGIVFCYGNYSGDVMNFDMAAEALADLGIEARTILVTDDVASAPKGDEDARRGIAGDFFIFKILGARAAEMATLDEVEATGRKANANCRSMGVALGACIVPAAGRATFSLSDGEMEIGLGVHGEPGLERVPLQSAERVAKRLLDAILTDLPFERGDEVAVLINGLGATPNMELFILYRTIARELEREGIRIHRAYVGPYITSLEMAGASVTLLKLDAELARLIDAEADCTMFVQR